MISRPSLWAGLCLALLSFFPLTSYSQGGEPEVPPEAELEAGGEITPAAIGGDEDPQVHLMTVIEPNLEVDTTSLSPMGDSYDPSSGEITFSVTDISVPGNSEIPVELSRWVPRDDYDTGGPVGWTWNLPFIRGHFADMRDGHTDTGWQWGTNNWHNGKNCSGSAQSVVNNRGELIDAESFWQGKLLHIPGVTSETFLDGAGGVQVTKSNFKIVSCIQNANGQEGIVVAGPNGLKYTFNQIKTYYNGRTMYKDPIVRTRLLMVTKIEDRFGNFVDYSYTPAGALQKIEGSDGRLITIEFDTSNRVVRAVSGGRPWTYSTTGTSVTLPNGRSWTYSNVQVMKFKPNKVFAYNHLYALVNGTMYYPNCAAQPGQLSATVTSPNGLTTIYTFQETIHKRSNVEPGLYDDIVTGYNYARNLHCTLRTSLIEKSISGPGVGANWTYAYSGGQGSYTTNSGLNGYYSGTRNLAVPVGGYPAIVAAAPADYRAVTITGSTRQTVLYINRRDGHISENMVVAEDVLNAAGTAVLQREEKTFVAGAYVGASSAPVSSQQTTNRGNLTQRVVRQYQSDGTDTYTTAWSNFDSYGLALSEDQSNNFSSATRHVERSYLHDTSLWLIGLPLTEQVGGVTVSENHYDASRQVDWTKSFGLLQASYTYSGGLLATMRDPLHQPWTYSDYQRGVPRSVALPTPAGTSVTRTVNDFGEILSMTDPLGATTSYRRDNIGRIDLVTYPTGDTVSWTSKGIAYDYLSSYELGVQAGSLRMRSTAGRQRISTYHDALLRPVLIEQMDTTTGIASYVRKTYDPQGRMVFESYPASVSNPSSGVNFSYDAMDRLVVRGTTAGQTLETIAYLAGNKRRVTDANGYATTTIYQAFGALDQSNPVQIDAPENQRTVISRDVFGNMTSATQTDLATAQSVTRSYVYDANFRLCKRIEPETGQHVIAYDAAGNVAWTADGQAGSTSSCDYASVPAADRTVFSYDDLNRETLANAPGTDSDVTTTYLATGDVKTRSIASPASTWTYNYNKRRLLEDETLTAGGLNFRLDYAYNALGQMQQLTYPSNRSVLLAPDAMGRSTMVGSGIL